MSILTVGSSPGRGMRLNLPIAIVPLRRTDTGFQPPAAYLGDEQMLRILGRGHSVPTVTELIFMRAQCFTNFATKAFCTLRNNNWIQLLFRKVQNAFVAKLVKHCALIKINSVTVGTEWPRPRMRNICSSPKYAAGGWNPVSVRLKGTMAIGRFNLIPRPGLEPTVRIDICESAVLNHFAI